MSYLACLPSLLCGLALCVEDVRHRRVPRAWVAAGSLAQLLAIIVVAVAENNAFVIVQSLLFALLCAAVQGVLALIRPGALGFGDVTCTFAIGLAVGMFGLFAVVVWWLAMGAFGLLWMAGWLRFDPQRHTPYRGKVPFVPVIVVAAVVAVACAAIWG
ncbi:prepilin peptidase [Bifidobacterium eulemuris]|uniref:Peptidase A24 n=1 Tax=Bifidobacterium eulemuris TaxID=1765219 RepID=A0A261GCW4_9BIFI|nr:prepilin peptidase [Bifidobacterium eulemuris]OZG69291.1 peptidase A24 [Bifidobacterium eulemuris]QOL31207.1 prepilin peptidase [Bifidobacterium eulemuris]